MIIFSYACMLQVREELINMLKNKETEQSRELSALQQDLEQRMKIVDEVRFFYPFSLFLYFEFVFISFDIYYGSIVLTSISLI